MAVTAKPKESTRVRRVLVVAYHYPPEASSSGVLRTLKFTRYLLEYGWTSTVLTLRRSAYTTVDPALESQIPEQVEISRTWALSVRHHLSVFGWSPQWLAIPDHWIGWYLPAVRAGIRLVRSRPVDLVFSTSPYPTANLIGRAIAKRFGLPHVVDIRDPWYDEPPEPGISPVLQFGRERLESLVVRDSMALTVTTAEHQSLMKRRYQFGDDRVYLIPNGYDEMDFAGLARCNREPDGLLRIAHFGPLNDTHRDPKPVLRALGEAARRQLLDLSVVRLQLFSAEGSASDKEIQNLLDAYQLRESVQFLPRLAYSESLAAMQNVDLLLLIQATVDMTFSIPAKVFEYLRSQKPVLAIALPGATTEFMKHVQGGWAIHPAEEEEIVNALSNIYQLWRSGKLHHEVAKLSRLQTYDRKNLTRCLNEVFTRVVGTN